MARRKVKPAPAKDNIYIIHRYMSDSQEVPIAAFRTLQAADEYAGACHQEFVDNGWNAESVRFVVSIVAFFDE